MSEPPVGTPVGTRPTTPHAQLTTTVPLRAGRVHGGCGRHGAASRRRFQTMAGLGADGGGGGQGVGTSGGKVLLAVVVLDQVIWNWV
jgi:hypothetical protein